MLIQIEGKNKFLGQIGQFRGATVGAHHAACASTRSTRRPADPIGGKP